MTWIEQSICLYEQKLSMMGDNSLWVSCRFFHVHWLTFVPEYFFKDSVINSFGRKGKSTDSLRRQNECLLLELRTAWLQLTVKDLHFLSSVFLSCNASYCMWWCHQAFSALPPRNRGSTAKDWYPGYCYGCE